MNKPDRNKFLNSEGRLCMTGSYVVLLEQYVIYLEGLIAESSMDYIEDLEPIIRHFKD